MESVKTDGKQFCEFHSTNQKIYSNSKEKDIWTSSQSPDSRSSSSNIYETPLPFGWMKVHIGLNDLAKNFDFKVVLSIAAWSVFCFV